MGFGWYIMKYNFSDIEDGSAILLMLHSGSVHMKLDATIINLIREDIAIITLETPVTQVLKFDNINLNVVYISDEGTPYIWKNAKIVYFKNNYILEIKGEGSRYNRRYTYRVDVGCMARVRSMDDLEYQIIVKDVSINGFSLADKKNELHLSIDDGVSVYFEDINHIIDLYGTVMRIEKKDDYFIYGLKIRRSCKDLPSYVTSKLGDKRNNMPPSYVI